MSHESVLQMENKLWLSLLLITIFLVQQTQTVCIEDERKALLAIKASLLNSYDSEKDNVLPTWVDYGECCDWERVKCNATDGCVTTLSLNNLKVSLDDDMQFEFADPTVKLWPLNVSIFVPFIELRSLNLSLNYLENRVLNTELERLSCLKKLEALDLSSNFHIDNDILPSLTSLASLKILDLSYTSLNGHFPATEFAALEYLELMDLSHCKFSDTFQVQGLEKPFILDKLESLNLRNNNFNESIISSLKFLPSLKYLDLGANRLSGSFPPHDCKMLKRLKRLESVSLMTNLNKSIISCLSALPSLKNLDLRYSRSFEGSFPFQELTGLKNLQTLDMGYCGLTSLVYNG